MKSTATLIEGFKSTVNNDRGHEVIADLPDAQGGTDLGATALELAVMALSGCISTIFAMVAKNSNVTFSSLSVEVDATKGEKTIEAVKAVVNVASEMDQDKLKRVLAKTMKMCPVGLLYENAGVKVETELVFK